MRNGFIRELLVHAKKDPSIILLTGDLGYSVIEEFRDSLPTQFLNMGITEQSTISFAAGLAKDGFKPFVYSIANFPTFRCFEQIRNDVCYMNSNVTIVAVGAGFAYGTAGYSHHLIEDISAMSALSNLEIYSPYDPEDVATCLNQILLTNSPSYLRIGRGGDQKINPDIQLEADKKPSIDKHGSILFTGSIGQEAIEASKILQTLDLKAETISVSQLSSIDGQRLRAVIDNKPFLTVEEHVLRGGFGSIIMEVTHKNSVNVSKSKLGVSRLDPEISGSTRYLRESYKVDSKSISEAFISLIENHHG